MDKKEESIPRKIAVMHPIFVVEFIDGYILRQLYEFFRQTLEFAPLSFSAGGITMSRGNGRNTLFTKNIIYASRLVRYDLDAKRINSPDSGDHLVNVNLVDFYNQIKSVAKKECVRIIQYAETPDVIQCQFYGGNKTNDGHVMVKVESFSELKYNIETKITATTEPNVKIPLVSFCSACSNLARSKHTYGIFKCYPRGVHLISSNQTVSTSRDAKWGSCDDPQILVEGEIPFYTTKVPVDIIKALTKMSGWNTNGIVSIYSREDGLVKLTVPIGCFADNETYLIDPSPNDE